MNDMVDMSQFIEAKSDQLTADDLIGRTLTITVTRVTGSDSGEQPVAIHFEGDNGKPFKPCKTMRRVLLGVWGKYASEYVGRSMTLYRDDSVTFGGLQVGGIRISHMSHIDEARTIVVNKTRGKKAGIKIQPLKDAPAQRQGDGADAASRWAGAYVAAVNKATDRVELEQFAEAKAAKLEELRTKRPDLHERCIAALEAGRAEFAQERKPDDQHGEQFNDVPEDF